MMSAVFALACCVAEDDAGILSAEMLANRGDKSLDTLSIVDVVEDGCTVEIEAWEASVEETANVVLA
jgi:hypothetical protein